MRDVFQRHFHALDVDVVGQLERGHDGAGSEHRTSKSEPWMNSMCGQAGAKDGEDAGRGFQVLGGGDEFIEVEVDGGIESW